MSSRTGKIAGPTGVDTIVDAADVGVRATRPRTTARNRNFPTKLAVSVALPTLVCRPPFVQPRLVNSRTGKIAYPTECFRHLPTVEV